MHYETDEHRWKAIKSYLDLAWKKPSEYPGGLLLSLDDEEITSLFTSERIRMIRLLKSQEGLAMSEIAERLKRKLPAVERDLKILEGMGVVELRKRGRTVYPAIEKEMLIIPLMKARKIEEVLKGEKRLVKA